MTAVRTSLHANDLPDELGALRRRIEAAVPVGFNSHDTGQVWIMLHSDSRNVGKELAERHMAVPGTCRGSYIVRGLGNPDAYCSESHGRESWRAEAHLHVAIRLTAA